MRSKTYHDHGSLKDGTGIPLAASRNIATRRPKISQNANRIFVRLFSDSILLVASIYSLCVMAKGIISYG